jgi:hypothetical protein
MWGKAAFDIRNVPFRFDIHLQVPLLLRALEDGARKENASIVEQDVETSKNA